MSFKTVSTYFFKILALIIILVLAVNTLPNIIYRLPITRELTPKSVKAATYQYTPVSGSLPIGTQNPVSATNMGSYKGALSSDNVYWSTNAVAGSGLEKRINIDGVELNGANKLIITYEGYVNNAALTYQVQIYDNVNAVWRNLNDREAALSNTADTTYTYEIYDGYFQNGGNPILTPLSNFITADANKRIQLRIYSTNSNTFTHYLDRLQVESAIDSLYTPASMTKIGGGAVTNNYTYTFTSDNNAFSIANTPASKIDYYFSFKRVQTYQGANSILVNYRGAVSNRRLRYRLKIYNFTTSSWENLSSRTLRNKKMTAKQFAKSNVNLSDYISSGEIRVGIYTTSSRRLTQSTDSIYIIIGSVNNDIAKSEISFGAVAGKKDVSATRDLDTSARPSTWRQSTAATAVSPYAYDWGGTYGTNFSASANIGLPVTIPSSSQITGVRYAARFRSNSNGSTAQLGLYDYSGQFNGVAVAGGWTDVGATSSKAYTYTDGILQVNPENYIDTSNNLANIRLRTSFSTDTASVVRNFDFAFISIRWINDSQHPSLQYEYAPVSGSLPIGTQNPVSATNMGSYKGALSSDNVYWSTNAVAGSGLEKRINIDGVELNGANKLIITYEGYVNNAALTYQVQIYDNINAVWRNLNDREAALSNTADTTYTYEIYDGYFQNGGNPISTPLSNFVTADANKRIQLRIYSTNSNTFTHYLDRLQVESAIDSLYTPASMTKIGGGAVTNNYTFTYKNDNNSLSVANTNAQPLDYYFSFKNVQFYPDANTILVNYEGLTSNSALTYKLKIYNFSMGEWEDLSSADLNNTTKSAYQFAKPNVNLINYINGGEVRIGIYTTSSNTFTQSTDRIYIMIGSVNSDLAKSEVSFGNNSGGTDVAATRDMDASLAASSTWQCSTAATAASPYAYDWGGTYGTNYSAASNLSFPVTIPNTAQVTGIRYAARFRSNSTNNTVQPGLYDFSGQYSGVTVAGGWTGVGLTNNSSVYTYTDGIFQINPENYIDTVNNLANMRLRTSASTSASIGNYDFDFAFVSIRYIGLMNPVFGSLSLSGVNVTWTNVGPLTPPNNNGKGLTANVTASGGGWRLTVFSQSGDANGRLYSTDQGPSVYQGTFKWNVDGVSSTPGPTYTTSQADFLTTEQNVADNGPAGSYSVKIDYTLGNPTWNTNAAPVTGYSATHYYTLYYGL